MACARSDDLGEGERLGHVVVAADREPGDLVLDAVAGGEEQHGHPDAVGPQPSRDLEAVEVGEHHVEHDEVGRVLLGGGQRRPSGHGLADLEAFVAQGGGDGVDDRRFIVDDQDLLLRRAHCPPPSRVSLHRRCASAVSSL